MLKRSSAALAGLVVAVACVTSAADDQPDSKALIGRIRKVGREGKNNAEAAKAWKALVAKGPAALLPILDGMDDDDPTSSNWLRPAFEAVAEKALDAGKLPRADLEKFVLDTKKGGAARRLAYEWLVKLDRDAPKRLLPNMLLDPSHELRRDAIALAIEEAQAQKDQGRAREIYRKALKGACDKDQIEAIAAALGKLGEKVDVVKHLGFVTGWHVAGPFDNRKGVGYAAVYPPEKGVDLSDVYDGVDGKEVKWAAHVTDKAYGLVDLNKVVGKLKGVVAYAYAVVDSPEERPVEIRTGCITSMKIFLNGKQVFAHDEYHHGAFMDQYVARVTLKKGENRLLLKVCQNEQKEKYAEVWFFQLRLCDRVGSAVPFTQKAAKKEDK